MAGSMSTGGSSSSCLMVDLKLVPVVGLSPFVFFKKNLVSIGPGLFKCSQFVWLVSCPGGKFFWSALLN